MQKETVQQRKMLSPASALRLIVVWMSAVAEVRQAAVLEVAPEDLNRGSYDEEARYAMRVASVLLGCSGYSIDRKATSATTVDAIMAAAKKSGAAGLPVRSRSRPATGCITAIPR